MSNFDKQLEEELEKLKKKKKQTVTPSQGDLASGRYSYLPSYKTQVAPILQNSIKKATEESLAPVKKTVGTLSEDGERTWFQKGAFEDGYQFGDITKTILGSSQDLFDNALAGVLDIGEKAVDALATIAPYIAQGMYYSNGGGYNIEADRIMETGFKQAKKETAEFVEKDLYDSKKVAEKLTSNSTIRLLGADTEKGSVFGEKSDSLVQSAGQLGAQIGTNLLLPGSGMALMGVTAFGGESENALKNGATLEEAVFSGAISAGAEILTEKIGGISFGGKTLTDAAFNQFSRQMTGKLSKVLLTTGKVTADALSEGGEEILSGYMSAIGQKLSYMEDKEIEELFSNEDLLESFIGGVVLGGMGGVGGVVQSNSKGVDYVTELTKNEQKVVQQVYKDELAKREEKGKLSASEKSKLYDQVVERMEKGYISTDTIESALGDRSAYDSLQKESEEFKTLYETESGKLSKKQQDRLAELEAKNKATPYETALKDAKDKYSKSVFDLVRGENKGKGSRLLETYNERARMGQDFQADFEKYKGTKHEEAARKTIESAIQAGANNTNRVHDLVDMAAQISADTGRTFYFKSGEQIKNDFIERQTKVVSEIESIPEAKRTAEQTKKLTDLKDLLAKVESGETVVNGDITEDGITLNLDSTKPLNRTVGHEVTHSLEKAKSYKELKESLFAYAKSKGIDIESELNTRKLMYEGITDANPEAELVSDLVGDFLFTDSNYIKKLSTDNRNVFQKIWDEVKYLYSIATAGSQEARELAKVKKAFEDAYRENGNKSADTKYSLAMVETVQPKSDKWSRTHTTEEAMARFPNMWNVASEESEVRNPTQITSTVNSYRKIYNFLQNEGFNGTILDASSGLGYGTRAGIEEYGFDVEDIEPYPDKSYNPKYKDYSTLNKKYDVIISNAVLNVLPQDQRDALAIKMGELLNDGGRLFVNVRGKDVESLAKTGKNIHLGNMEWIETVKGSYQKGFTKPELVAYLQDALGDGFTVEPTNMFGAVSAVVTKNGSAKYSLSDSDGKQLTKEQAEYFKDSKVRDRVGNLLKVYHTTKNDFTVFDDSRKGSNTYADNTYLGHFFTDNPDYMGEFPEFKDGKTEAYYLNMKKPIDMNNISKQAFLDIVEVTGGDVQEASELYDREYDAEVQRAKFRGDNSTIMELPRLLEELTGEYYYDSDFHEVLQPNYDKLLAKGYDGIINNMDGAGWANEYIVINSNQAKLTTNTNPTEDADIRYSLSDTEGRKLSKEQADYFKKSKVMDENGSLKVMYHGTPNGDFTVFKDGTYFTDNKEYADRYQNPGASSISAVKTASNPKTYEVYLDIKKPFDINDAEARRIYIEDYIKGGNAMGINPYLSDAEYAKIKTIDWTEGEDLREFLIDNGYDYDGLVLDEGADGGYGDEVKSRGTSYVVFSSEQVKNVYNTNPTNDPDIRYSLSNSNGEDTWSKIRDMQMEVNKLNESIREFEASEGYKDQMRKISEAVDSGNVDAGVKEYQRWLKESGLEALTEKRNALRDELTALRKSAEENRATEALNKEKEAIEKSGLSEADYFRKKAVKEFGYTPYFYDAGYIVTNGKMLNFSGEKGRHFGSRGQDHRAIGAIYAETDGTDALNRFVNDGNIRISPESPGIDLSATTEPTKEQYATIRNFIYQYADQGYFSVDISDKNGRVIGSLEYENRIYPTKVIADLKHYYATGEIRQPSGLDGFRSLSAKGEQFTPSTNDVYGKDFRVQKPAQDIAPVAENATTVSETESVAPVAVAENETTTEELFPDDTAPIQEEYEFLLAEREDIMGAMDAYTAVGDYESAERLMPEYEEVQTRIAEIEADDAQRIASIEDSDAPMEVDNSNPEDVADDVPLTKALVTDLAKQIKAKLGISNKRTAEVRDLIERYSKEEFPSKAHLYTEIAERFGIYTETEVNEELKGVKALLRTYGIKVDDSIKKDIADYGQFMRSNFGKVRFSNEGLPVDVAYKEFQEALPGYFPERINVPSDQLLRIVEVANMDTTITNEYEIDWQTLEEATDTIMNTVGEFKQNRKEALANKHGRESFESLMESADQYVPPYQFKNIAPTRAEMNAQSPDDIAPVFDTGSGQQAFMPEAEAKDDIAKRLDRSKAKLREEYLRKRSDLESATKNKNAYISQKAAELYQELRELRKGVRASEQLGYLLDFGYDWSSVRAALVNIQHTPDHRVNENSAIESIARKMLNEDYEDSVYEISELEAEYERNVAQLEADAEKERTEGRKATRKELHENIVDNIKTTFRENGFEFDDALKNAKDLSTFATVDNTPQRVMEKALGYKQGQVLGDLTVNKVAQNETEGIRWLNSFTDRKTGLLSKISKQYKIKPGSKESAAAQMYAEGFYVGENNAIIAYGDKELAADFPDVKVQENIKKLARDPRIRQIYDETLAAINESRTRNAYPEIPRLDNYFLHFRAMEDTFSRLGLPFNPNDIRAKDLPTDLNGVTADLKPGQPYFASAKHRMGKRTSFDLLGGLEKYLTSAKNQIYHIDDIQTLRALRNYVAETYGQAHGLENIDTMSDEEAEQRINEVYNSHLSTFAKFLNEEANVLAGKTSLIDRGLEGVIGRRGITFLDSLNKQVGANMVGFNVSSSLTNFLAPVQAFAKSNKFDFVKAMAQTSYNKIGSIFGKGDTFAEDSPVMIRRKGADRFYRTPFEKVGDAGYVFMSAVDDISTELVARTKYNELTRKGMDSQQAHYETDKWVSRLMGDRSLGQQPQLYNSKMLGLVTKFQLEVRNQLDSQFYDTIQEAKVSTEDIENGLLRNAKKAAKITSTFVQLAVAQHLFGKAFESVAGYNPAFDIIGAIIKAFGWDDEEESEDTVLDNIEQGFLELLGDLPYTSTLTGGRIPIESALPITELIKGEDRYGNEKSRWDTLKEVAPYYILPGGYGQLKKTAQGLGMFSEDHPIAGSYTNSGNLRFPVEDTLGNRIQAGLFGQYASGNARDYFDNERSPLKEKQIQEFIDVGMTIQDYWKYRDGLSKLNTLAEKAEYISGLDLTTAQKNVLINNIADRKEDIDMSDYGNYGSFEEFDFAEKNPEKYSFLKENNVSYSQYKNFDEDTKDAYTWAFNNPEKHTLSKAIASDLVTYRKYAKDLYDIKADKDSSGKSISGSRKAKVVDYINNMDADYGEKIILFKSEYPADDTYNYEIIEYLDSRADISYEEEVTILRELGFTVLSNGTVQW